MTLKKHLEKLMKLLDSDKRHCKKTIKSLQEVLKALKQKEKQLQADLAQVTDAPTQQTIQNQLDVIAAQRAKGKTRLLELRAQSQAKST